MEVNFEADSENDAEDAEEECFFVVKKIIGNNKEISLDLVFEIEENEKNL